MENSEGSAKGSPQMSKKISELSDAANLNGTELIPIVQSSETVKTAIRPLRPYDAVIDARTDAQAGTALLTAVERLNAAGQGGDIKVMAGAVDLGKTTLTLSEGVRVSGAATGLGGAWDSSKGTRLRWTGPTDLGPCVQLAGHGAGLTDLMVASPSNLEGHVIDTALTGIRSLILQRVRVLANTNSTSYYGVALHDFFQADVQSVEVVGPSNGWLLDAPKSIYNVGNAVFSNIAAYLYSNSRVGINCISRDNASTQGMLNLITFNQAQVLATSGIGTGCTGLRVHGANRLLFNNADIENTETLLELSAAGTTGAVENTFISPYFNASVFTAKNVFCDSASFANTFVGGFIATPNGYNGALDDDATRGGDNPNMYLHVKASHGYLPYP